MVCMTCGTTLSDVPVIAGREKARSSAPLYDNQYGEADLFEGELSRRGETALVGGVILLGLAICGLLLFTIAPRFVQFAVNLNPAAEQTATLTLVPTRGGPAVPVAATVPLTTNTPRPTLQMETVTPAPPTPTITPTPGPCMVTVQPGDDLISIASRCGHRSMDVMAEIQATNNLDSLQSIIVGQELIIPWPTPTVDPNLVVTEEPTVEGEDGSAAGAGDSTLSAVEITMNTSDSIATQTLQPGLTWHIVQPQENILVIASNYGADLEILSQLNPEVPFSQCDFGSATGGPTCIVQIYEGQRIRVPAPTPVPTLSPTPSGSETPTPTATPTFNAPSLISPDNRALFLKDELITLRWVPTGTLGPNETYLVEVHDLTADQTYTATTGDVFFIVPDTWQGLDGGGRHEYEWQISVIDSSRPDDPSFTTERRMFSWEALGAAT